ncbi:MAG: VWA domain-containing protein [Flexilinea flocculi]|nr:VWA domain-containing protein [Flexilinea flocculi]
MYSHTGDTIFNAGQGAWWDGARNFNFDTPLITNEYTPSVSKKKNSGKRTRIISKDLRGYYVKARPAIDRVRDIAFDATIRAAAPFQKSRKTNEKSKKLIVQRQDIMKKVRMRKSSHLLLFLVDLSWSMAVQERMAITKSAILSLLTDAYQQRDRVGLITFQKDGAKVILPPTHSVMLAERSMKRVKVGGKTPLSAGLWKAYELLKHEKQTHPDVNALLIILTDGAGNVAMGNYDPLIESRKIAEKIRDEGFRSIVIDMDQYTFDQGLAVELAKQLDAPCYLVAGLKADELIRTVKREL